MSNILARSVNFTGSNVPTNTVVSNCHIADDIDFKKVSTANCVTGNKGNQILFGSGVGFFPPNKTAVTGNRMTTVISNIVVGNVSPTIAVWAPN